MKSLRRALAFILVYGIHAAAVSSEPPVSPSKLEAQERLMKIIRDEHKDPESVKFRNVQTYSTLANINDEQMDTGMFTVCGEVDGKNSYGGYGGYRAFMITNLIGKNGALKPSYISEYNDGTRAFATDYVARCREQGEFYMRTK